MYVFMMGFKRSITAMRDWFMRTRISDQHKIFGRFVEIHKDKQRLTLTWLDSYLILPRYILLYLSLHLLHRSSLASVSHASSHRLSFVFCRIS